jgi:hypothetical protein
MYYGYFILESRGRLELKDNETTCTFIPSGAHDAVKAFAAMKRIKIPAAYEQIIMEGLKTFNFDVSGIKK